ncbi:hypothetical protein [Nannocystis sp.]|uniref:hypothetical protein n=1 Tax=Nannocystis sp. TaxID=1962667 RepID=UPI0025CC84E8|nr:hypothetical protein [Nannocystis sp.]MBK7829154.1 hypothetical protein [Nannocystis sp.]
MGGLGLAWGEQIEEQGGGAGGGEEGGVERLDEQAQGFALQRGLGGGAEEREQGFGGGELVAVQAVEGREGDRVGVDAGGGDAQLELLPGEGDGGQEVGGTPVWKDMSREPCRDGQVHVGQAELQLGAEVRQVGREELGEGAALAVAGAGEAVLQVQERRGAGGLVCEQAAQARGCGWIVHVQGQKVIS